MQVLAFGEALDRAGAVGRFPVQIGCSVTVRRECQASAVRRPNWAYVRTGSERESGECLAGEVPDPDVPFFVARIECDAAPIGRDAWMPIGAGLSCQRHFSSVPIHPDERAVLSITTGDIDQGTGVRDAELRGRRCGTGGLDAFGHGYGTARHLELVRIKRHGQKRSIQDVDEVPRGYVTGVSTAFDQNLSLTGLERMHHNLGVVPVRTVPEGKEHGFFRPARSGDRGPLLPLSRA